MPNIYRGNYDVIVCGGGTAGTISAIAAARNGAKTLLVERGPFLGGVAVMGFWPHTFYGHTGKKAVGGIPQEIIDELVNMGGSLGHLRYEGGHMYGHTPVDCEMLKILLVKMVMDAGVDLMLNSVIKEITMKDRKIQGVSIQTKAQTFTAGGKIIVDTTGDGDIAYLAGAPFHKGREKDGKVQPVTLVMRLTNVDLIKIVENVPSDKPVLWADKPRGTKKTPVYFAGRLGPWDDTEEARELFTDKNHQIFCLAPWESDAIVNTSRIVGVDGTNYDEVNNAEAMSRLQIYNIYRFLRQYVPGFEHSNIVSGHFLGVRETRRFIGDYELKEEDILAGRKFDDQIGLGAYPLDMHDPDGGNVTFVSVGDDGTYGIPYRCLTPQEVDNIFVAGRNISATHKALASVRSIAASEVMGQAVGTAAAIVARNNLTTREVNVQELQTVLKQQNVILD